MSAESHQNSRAPSHEERQLLLALIGKASDLTLPTGWLDSLGVRPMADGGMGSLRLTSLGGDAATSFGRQASELVFEDADGVKVIASLNVDLEGSPIELDLWKTDFSPLIRIPIDFSEKS